MKHLVKPAVALIIAATLALPGDVLAATSEPPPDSGGGGGWAHSHLSKKQIKSVRKGARFIGATKKQTRKILKKKFRTKNTPVRYELVTRGRHKAKNIATAATSVDGQEERCGFGVAVLKVENYVGWDIATYRMRQRWCWDGVRVTDVYPPEYTGTEVHWLGDIQMLSWSNEPTGEKDFFDDMTTNRNPRARHSTHRQRKLEFCPFRIQICVSERAPWLLLSKRYNGTYVPGGYANHSLHDPRYKPWWPR